MARGTQKTKTEAGAYYSTLTDWICFVLFTETWILVLSNGQFVAHIVVAKKIALLLWTGCQGTQMNNCHENLNTCFTWLNGIQLNEILAAMENFEKCSVAMLGGWGGWGWGGVGVGGVGGVGWVGVGGGGGGGGGWVGGGGGGVGGRVCNTSRVTRHDKISPNVL